MILINHIPGELSLLARFASIIWYLAFMRKSLISILMICIAWIGVLYFFREEILGEKQVHYHANFLVSIRGVPVDFSREKYMQKVEKCYLTTAGKPPEELVHMHDGNGWLVHVHAAWVTWWDFFSGIHWIIWTGSIRTDTWAIFTNNASDTIRYILNSTEVSSPMWRVIASRDRLLIDYSGDDTGTLLWRFAQVPSDADAANRTPDPTSCGWNE